MDCIFVTGYINLDSNKNRDPTTYINNSLYLLNNDKTFIIFIEKHIFLENCEKYGFDKKELELNKYFFYEDVYFHYVEKNNKYFVFYEKNEIYLYKYKSLITKFDTIKRDEKKDTIDYMFVQCNKTEWMSMAIDLFKSIHGNKLDKNIEYVWIDFGIYHMINNDSKLINHINNIYDKCVNNKHSEKIRISSCWDVKGLSPVFLLNDSMYIHILWYFAGSIFGGTENIMKEFSKIVKEECIKTILERHLITWEVNVWGVVCINKPELFDDYICHHNDSIFDNY